MLGLSDKGPPRLPWVTFVVLFDAATIDQTVYGWHRWIAYVPFPYPVAIALSVFTLRTWMAFADAPAPHRARGVRMVRQAEVDEAPVRVGARVG